MRGLHRYESILDAIGWTPIVRLNRITAGLPAEVWAKLEFLNPMGSVKDRIARFMVEKAEADGRLRPGGLILEASSGNTALGLALVAIQKGYTLKVVVRDSTSPEKIALLRALGVDIEFVDANLTPEHPDSYNNKAPRLARELPGCFFPDQHNNRENNETHYLTTGPEIWEQMEGRIDYFIAGMGTGGTVAGVGRYLKERDPHIKVIAVEPEGSVFAEYFRTGRRPKPKRYLMEGLGDEFIIGTADFEP
ncbi:MAG: PLP-dependent cysteine synthase family protein, partial [Thermoanaerobaculum sp.]